MSEKTLKGECLELLYTLSDRLVDLQVSGRGVDGFGALTDPACGVLHTRAGEAVFPLAVAGKHGGKERFLQSAVDLGDWLVSQQTEEGSWLETPGKWRGTTTDQLLALCGALPILAPRLGAEGVSRWRESIRRAAGFLAGFVSEATAHINYCATTAASLAAAWKVTGQPELADKARALARQIAVEKINPDGLVIGEGHRDEGVLHGIDPGYNIDMTLWGLALYARLAEDGEVEKLAAQSLAAHLPLVYPDGSIDGSWGVRSNKWTTYGSKTAHGAQAGFGLLAHQDARFRTAALRNLRYLEGMVHEGLVGYGPQWWERSQTACIYPTFTRASNLALAIEHADGEATSPAPLPCDEPFAKLLKSVGVAIVRTGGLMATVTAYGYKAPGVRPSSKYMARPAGGCLSNLWFDRYGFLQAASQTRYRRWEPMHFPEAGDLLPLGPRVEQVRGSRVYSSLNEFDARISLDAGKGPVVSTSGVLRDDLGRSGGVRYEWKHSFGEQHVRKQLRLKAGMGRAFVRVIEPVVDYTGTKVEKTDPRTVQIIGPRGSFRLRLEEGEADIIIGGELARYWWPMPALQGFPITLRPRRLRLWSEITLVYILERVD
jgi:hypothetical protein